MSDLSVGNHADVVLSPGDVLRVSTGGVATVVVAYGAPAGTITITANTQDFGPYSVPAKLAVNAVTGTASYSNVAAYPVVKMPDGTLQAGGSPVDEAGNSTPSERVAVTFSRSLTAADHGKILEIQAGGLTLSTASGALPTTFFCVYNLLTGTTSFTFTGGATCNGAPTTITRAASANKFVGFASRATANAFDMDGV